MLFYIGKTDGLGMTQDLLDPAKRSMNLLQVGRVRVSLSPAPVVDHGKLRWTLDPARSEIHATFGAGDDATEAHLCVDTNRPVVHVSAQSVTPRQLSATTNS